jgi:hypothetical protein
LTAAGEDLLPARFEDSVDRIGTSAPAVSRLLAPERFDQGEDVLAGRANAIGAVGGRAAGPVSALCGRDRPIPFLRKAVEDPCPAGGMVGKPVEAHYERPAAGLKDRNLQSACLNRPMTDAVGRLGPPGRGVRPWRVAAALEDALTQWIERNSEASRK